MADVERAARFYLDAFDGRWLIRPIRLEGETAEAVMGGPPGTAFRLCLIGFGAVAVELFEFCGTALPDWAASASAATARLPHFGVTVADVDDALARVERAGGRRLWPDVWTWGSARVIYVADPDGNTIELLDAPAERIAELTAGMFAQGLQL